MDGTVKWLLSLFSTVFALLIVALLAWIFTAVQGLQQDTAGLRVQMAAWEKAVAEMHDVLNKETDAIDRENGALSKLRLDLCRRNDGHACD